MLTNRNRKKKNGSILVDAAIVLPVFILAIGLIIGLIAQAGREEKTVFGLKKAALAVMDAESILQYELRDSEEICENLYADNIIRIAWPGKVYLKTMVFRPFLGESVQPKEGDVLVHIFPKAGIRYHCDDCIILNRENHIQVFKSKAVEEGYTPCKICGGGEK